MSMRAKDAIEIGQDITPSFPPLAFSLYDSSLSSHCSSCFSSLPPSLSSTSPSFLSYCSNPHCFNTPSSEHHLFLLLRSHPSLWPHPDSSDLRLSLRLLHLISSSPASLPSRLFGLLTNHRKILMSDEECSSRVRSGARVMAMAMARALRGEGKEFCLDNGGGDCGLEEAVLCLVMTNAVEVSLDGGVPIGVAVYDWRFSWINHSCSPNSCFRFVSAFEEEEVVVEFSGCDSMQIMPFCGDVEMEEIGACTASQLHNVCQNYGPRVIVRSIKTVQQGEEVTITYTDLLQPTMLRRSELLLKYHFSCNCRRCSAVPRTYVDHAIEEIFSTDLCKNGSSSLNNPYKEKAVEMLRDMLNCAIEEYLEIGDAVKCCEKIEDLLSEAPFKQQFVQAGGASCLEFRLSPLHHLSLNAFTTLVSTYKICASLSFGEVQFHNFDMSRTSAAYCLLLAGATHHLFLSEPSLIPSAATFWMDTGQSLLNLARSSSWSSFKYCVGQDLSLHNYLKCTKCSLMDKFKSNFSYPRTQFSVSDEMPQEFLMCISIITPKVWSFLVQGCKYLKDVKDPIDFSWLGAMRTSAQSHHYKLYDHEGGNGNPDSSVSQEPASETRINTFQLGVHCLLYGGYLSNICHGACLHKIQCIKDLLYC